MPELGGPISRRQLHIIYLCDVSGSMSGRKIQSLNDVGKSLRTVLKDASDSNPAAEVCVRILAFSSTAKWMIPNAVTLENFSWPELSANGTTNLGAAYSLLAAALEDNELPSRCLPPVLILMSDGQPDQGWENKLEDLMSLNWFKKSVRMAIAIGDDASHAVLAEFIGNAEQGVLEAHNAETLKSYIRWASTQAVSASSRSVALGASAPPLPIVNNDDDIW